MVSPHVSNVFLSVTSIKNIWQWQVFSIYFGYFFSRRAIMFMGFLDASKALMDLNTLYYFRS